jgi:arsenate reductase
MIKIYHNNRCRKSREALEVLEASGKEFEVVKYLEDVPSEKELKEIISLLDIGPLDLVRKNEAIWKENFKGKDLDDSEIITIMHKHPKLIERPIVIHGKKAEIGRPIERIINLLK